MSSQVTCWPMRLASHLSDILVPDLADLLDICRALGDVLERVAEEQELILLRFGHLDIDTFPQRYPVDDLLADEVTVPATAN